MSSKSFGDHGEELARQHLIKKGFVILESNWRCARAEIDIIARTPSLLIFVEVKTRQNNWAGEPWQFVSIQKQKLLIRAANSYLQKCVNDDPALRFDVVSVIVNKAGTHLEHLENAFYPML